LQTLERKKPKKVQVGIEHTVSKVQF